MKILRRTYRGLTCAVARRPAPAATAIVRIIVFVFYEAQHSKGYEGAQAGRTEKYEGSHNAYSRKAADAPTYSMFGC